MIRAVNEYHFKNSETDDVCVVVVEEEAGSTNEENDYIAFDKLAEKTGEEISRDKPDSWYLDDIFPFGEE